MAASATPAAAWLVALADEAPDVVACWRALEVDDPSDMRRELARRAVAGSAAGIAPQLAATGRALARIVEALPEVALAMPGGEADWNVAEAVGHAASARAGLCLAASRAAARTWPTPLPDVVPGVPGAADATRDDLLGRLATSSRIVERAARTVVGHELEPCPLEHPLVGRLRAGEWLLFTGVHDVMHLEQLHGLAGREQGSVDAAAGGPRS